MNYEIQSTAAAKEHASTLNSDATYYKELVQELTNAKSKIIANWEGDSKDINDIVTRITAIITTFSTKIIPALVDLSAGVTNLANDIEATADNTIEVQAPQVVYGPAPVNGMEVGKYDPNGGSSKDQASADQSSADQAKASGEKEKPGFWEYHGQDFADDWDYSGCDSGLDYIGKTVSGAVETVGSTVNFVVDGAGEILDWFF